jgi:hypothetical protein
MEEKTPNTCQLKVAKMCHKVLPTRFHEGSHGWIYERQMGRDVEEEEERGGRGATSETNNRLSPK